MKPSLRNRLILLWLMMVVICVALSTLLWNTYRQGAGFQIEAGARAARDACAAIQREYGRYGSTPSASETPHPDLLYVLLQLTLTNAQGVEGGVWSRQRGFIAYAFPTYEGGGVKRDVPEAEQPRIAKLAKQSLTAGALQLDLQRGQREATVVAACPFQGKPDLAAWTLKRVPAALAGEYNRLTWGLGVLLLFVLGSGAWLAMLLRRWSGHLTRMERALAEHSLDNLPQLDPTGEDDLDRMVVALNQFSGRLQAALAESAKLAKKLAQADRLAALGRMTAGVAHEIRNPIAAMRLKAENALAQPGPRQSAALEAILGQIERLDKLVQSMLAMTQPLALQLQSVALQPWLEEHVNALRERAQAAGVVLACECGVEQWVFDPLHVGRALDNLLWNALQHTPSVGEIQVRTRATKDALTIRVSDTGTGIDPALVDHIFEPFASGCPDGTGLGLALTREILLAHGGEARLVASDHGAIFELELPWRAS
jgi:signal transduction histidine kinase